MKSGSAPQARATGDMNTFIREAQKIMDVEEELFDKHRIIGTMDWEDGDDSILATAMPEVVRLRPAMDSGAVKHCARPGDMPADAEPIPNVDDKHFTGAGGSRIHRHGSCKTIMKDRSNGRRVGVNWQLAEVTRPLNSVSETTGPADHPIGLQDVLFNNRCGYVMPPGVVDEILKKYKPICQYPREGGLYIADMDMSSFPRQDVDA